MRRVAVALAAGLLLAGCGGSKQATAPEIALLTDVRVSPEQVVFEFRSAPGEVRTRFHSPSDIAESGSGRRVPLLGRAALVVTFTPAATADLRGETVVPTYHGPKRIRGSQPVREVVKIGDFEAQLDWAIGLDRRVPYDVERDGDRVTVTFSS